MNWADFFRVSFLICFGYFLLIHLYHFAILAVSLLENRFRARQRERDRLEIARTSDFTVPISVIVTAYNEESIVRDTILSVLRNGYPNFELIVVNDGSTDRTLERLVSDFRLEPATLFYRRTIPTKEVRAIYRSRDYPNLRVVDKENGGSHADAANVGLNLARYRYILSLDADTVLEEGAMLKAVRLALRNPKEVVGVGSLIGIGNGFDVRNGEVRERRINGKILVQLQVLEYFRTFLLNRLGWSRGNFTMCVSGAFSLWRKDLVLEMGGFQKDFSCDDLELTFRVHDHFRKNGIPYRILSLPDPVAWTEAPSTTYPLYLQRNRWQRVTNESVFHYRRMLFNPRYGSVGFLGAPYMLVAEVIGPWIELLSYLLIPLGYFLGMLSFADLGLFLLCSAGLTWTFTLASLLLFDWTYPLFRMGEIVRLSIVGAAEYLGFRQILSVARLAGTISNLRGYKGWDKFEREPRKAAAA